MGAPDIKTLTGLRGYAALGVCIFHYTLLWTDYDNWAMPFARHGNYGVSVFFVLSGFILLHVYRTWFDREVTAARYGRFMWHRIARIYPLHILLLLIAAGLILSGAMAAMPRGEFDSPFAFILNVLLVHGWGLRSYGLSWNGPVMDDQRRVFRVSVLPISGGYRAPHTCSRTLRYRHACRIRVRFFPGTVRRIWIQSPSLLPNVRHRHARLRDFSSLRQQDQEFLAVRCSGCCRGRLAHLEVRLSGLVRCRAIRIGCADLRPLSRGAGRSLAGRQPGRSISRKYLLCALSVPRYRLRLIPTR